MTAGLLSDKVALVTGAARGIGRAIAMAFAEHGAHVAVADLLLDGGQAVTREIDDAGGPRAIALHLDVPD
ncbi:MAG TPA: SDR family NAD(P)-dependent oxidoreductase, partial [candidate division Zixibacteria bacterium]|nr:SDR family NAD(P)-dependent oxidoreductase [candidate division Zixibacteria bacterium]